MTEQPFEDLARQAATGDQAAAELFLDRLVSALRLLDPQTFHRAVRPALMLQNGATVPTAPTELAQWARQLWTEEELAAGRRDLQELREKGGGLRFEDFLPELEIARRS